MKKLIGILLTLVMLLSLFTLAGCSKSDEGLKFGLGSVAYLDSIKASDGDANGSATASATFAAVLLDKDGKIVNCRIDAVDCKLSFSSKGEVIPYEEYKTKRELGDAYGMKKAGASKEWFEQVDAFEKAAKGKSLDEVKAMVATEGKGSQEVINAGCTIVVTDFVTALEKAINNAKDATASGKDAINLGVATAPTGKSATEETAGKSEVEITVSAVCKDADSKVTAIVTDSVSASVAFDIKGIPAITARTDLSTKRELGDAYGMKKAGAKKEWFEQVDAFDKECVGKTASEIAAMVTSEGKGNDALVNAGCTIAISNIVKAADKAAK